MRQRYVPLPSPQLTSQSCSSLNCANATPSARSSRSPVATPVVLGLNTSPDCARAVARLLLGVGAGAVFREACDAAGDAAFAAGFLRVGASSESCESSDESSFFARAFVDVSLA